MVSVDPRQWRHRLPLGLRQRLLPAQYQAQQHIRKRRHLLRQVHLPLPRLRTQPRQVREALPLA